MLGKLPLSERIKGGTKIEDRVADALRGLGETITKGTKRQDLDGTDYVLIYSGLPVKVQIKARESGNDIIFEIIKNWNTQKIGRDLRGDSEYYLCRDLIGVVRMFRTIDLKAHAIEILDEVRRDLAENPEKQVWYNDKWEVQKDYDKEDKEKIRLGIKKPRECAHKLIVFFKPNCAKVIKRWQTFV